MVGLGHARWSMERLRAGADEGCERMERDGTENGIEWDRMGQWLKEQWETRVCRSTKQQCTDVPSVQCGTLACGHVGVECLSLLDPCLPVSHGRASGKCDADADRPNPAEAATASAPSLQ